MTKWRLRIERGRSLSNKALWPCWINAHPHRPCGLLSSWRSVGSRFLTLLRSGGRGKYQGSRLTIPGKKMGNMTLQQQEQTGATGVNAKPVQPKSNQTDTTPAIQLVGIEKRFGPVYANRNVDLTVKKGSIHGIIGENGAGKSTLMSILYGFYHADGGEIYVNGVKELISDSQKAISIGIGMVHQHFMLVDTFHGPGKCHVGGRIRWPDCLRTRASTKAPEPSWSGLKRNTALHVESGYHHDRKISLLGCNATGGDPESPLPRRRNTHS